MEELGAMVALVRCALLIEGLEEEVDLGALPMLRYNIRMISALYLRRMAVRNQPPSPLHHRTGSSHGRTPRAPG